MHMYAKISQYQIICIRSQKMLAILTSKSFTGSDKYIFKRIIAIKGDLNAKIQFKKSNHCGR